MLTNLKIQVNFKKDVVLKIKWRSTANFSLMQQNKIDKIRSSTCFYTNKHYICTAFKANTDWTRSIIG